MTRAVSAHLLALWGEVRPGTIVTLRRAALSGEKAERTKAWTASGPFLSDTGVAVIRVDVAGTIVTYPLSSVSLGWIESAPAVSLGAVLDPPTVLSTPRDRFVSAVIGVACLYFLAIGGMAIAGWVFR